MGDAKDGRVHTVDIAYAFAVSRFPITRGQWRQFLSATGRSVRTPCETLNTSTQRWEPIPGSSWKETGFKQTDTHPVVCVSWNDAQDYASWLSKATGRTYRLLSEAEYEYINRAGTSSVYFWGNSSANQCEYANGADAKTRELHPDWPFVGCNDEFEYTSPVGTFQPNGFDLYDTTGNVWSWTSDCWHGNYSGAPTDGSPWGDTGKCKNHVARGGSWYGSPDRLRAAAREQNAATDAFGFQGFRLATSDLTFLANSDLTFRDCDDGSCPRMVLIPPGRFLMGSTLSRDAAHLPDEGPAHQVTIDTFAVGKFPVTLEQWRAYLRDIDSSGSSNCVGFDPSARQFERKPQYNWSSPGVPEEYKEDYPVVCVTFEEARRYAEWLSRKTRHHYRLLSESEYEYINGAGGGHIYLWGDSPERQCEYANGADVSTNRSFPLTAASAGCDDGYATIAPVGQFKPNRFGLYDTTGNVWSWTQDCYHDSYTGAPDDGAAWEEKPCDEIVVRGGSWYDKPHVFRVALRMHFPSRDYSAAAVGFRIARTD
jgi:formylglycine-generating enzyme required for sulfatase activity